MHQWLDYKGLEVPNPGLSQATELRLKQGLQRLVDWSPKSNWLATSNPTVGDDDTLDYFAGSLWLNTSTQAMFVCLNSSTGAAVWSSLVTGSSAGGLTITSQTSNYTAAPGDLVVCNVTGGSFTVSLPAITANARIGIKLGTVSGSNTVTIDPDGTDEIDNQSSVVLYVQNDYIEIQGDAANGQWLIVQDGIQLHKAKMHNTASQSLPTGGTRYTMQFDTIDYDTGKLASTSSESFTIRRSGVYLITAAIRVSVSLDYSERLEVRPLINGALVTGGRFQSTATNQTVDAFNSFQTYLTVNDVVTFGVLSGESSVSIDNGPNAVPYGAISEIR